MFVEMMTGSGGGEVKTGTFRGTSSAQSFSVNTGLGSALKGFVCFGVAYSNYSIQTFIRWDESLGSKFYAGGAYANVGISLENTSFTSTAKDCCSVISSISNGTVSMVGCNKNSNWYQQDYVWWAW